MKVPVIIGESCLDVYIKGKVKRLNPEAPVPLLSGPLLKKTVVGMAENVAENIKSLLGKDDIIHMHNQTRLIKTRFFDEDSNYILLRLDESDIVPQEESFGQKHYEHLSSLLFANLVSVVVISDYNKGFLSEVWLSKILFICNSHNIPTFMDTKKILGLWSSNAFCVKINRKEFENNIKNSKSIKNCFQEYMVVTNGPSNVEIYSFVEDNLNFITIPVRESEVIDVCGAGDSFLAGMVVNYIASKDIEKAAKFGAICGTVACKHFGTYIIKKSDVEF